MAGLDAPQCSMFYGETFKIGAKDRASLPSHLRFCNRFPAAADLVEDYFGCGLPHHTKGLGLSFHVASHW